MQLFTHSTKQDYPLVSTTQNFLVALNSLLLDVIIHSVIVIYSAVLFQCLLHLQTSLQTATDKDQRNVSNRLKTRVA